MLGVLEDIFYAQRIWRTSVWAFTKRDVPRYCSVTVPLYVGSVPTRLLFERCFFTQHFQRCRITVLPSKMEGRPLLFLLSWLNHADAGWLYWRLYETRFNKSDFGSRFEKEFNDVYGKYTKLLSYFGFMKNNGEQAALTEAEHIGCTLLKFVSR